SSDIRIVYSDARGENLDGGSRTIDGPHTFPVTVLLAPDTVAIVTVLRDNHFMDTRKISYDDLAAGSNSSTVTIPGEEETLPDPPDEPDQEQEPEHTEQPVQAEAAESDDGGESEENDGGQQSEQQ